MYSLWRDREDKLHSQTTVVPTKNSRSTSIEDRPGENSLDPIIYGSQTAPLKPRGWLSGDSEKQMHYATHVLQDCTDFCDALLTFWSACLCATVSDCFAQRTCKRCISGAYSRLDFCDKETDLSAVTIKLISLCLCLSVSVCLSVCLSGVDWA